MTQCIVQSVCKFLLLLLVHETFKISSLSDVDITVVIYWQQQHTHIYFDIQSKSTNELETKFDMDGMPEENLGAYTSPLRLFLLFFITLSLWYSVGVGVSQIKLPVAIMCAHV